ncbi:hypothetical protein FO519_009489, partial [Halicephalobus sp. NKZ332]
FEVWEDNNSSHYVKVLYWRDNESDLENITKFVVGCKGKDKCSFKMFKRRAQVFFPKEDVKKLCEEDRPFFT